MQFGFCVFVPIAVLAYVDSPLYQDKYVKPYTLFPSMGKNQDQAKEKMLLYPTGMNEEARKVWEQQMRASAPLRQRANEIYQENKKLRADELDNDSSPASQSSS